MPLKDDIHKFVDAHIREIQVRTSVVFFVVVFQRGGVRRGNFFSVITVLEDKRAYGGYLLMMHVYIWVLVNSEKMFVTVASTSIIIWGLLEVYAILSLAGSFDLFR